MSYKNAWLFFLLGVVLITIIDTLGVITYRKLNLKSTWLNVLSFGVYIGIGYLNSRQYGFDTALFINALLGTYDATIGLRLPFMLKLNSGADLNQPIKPISIKTVIFMIGVAGIFAMLGYAFSKL